jgi:hypothetical protein
MTHWYPLSVFYSGVRGFARQAPQQMRHEVAVSDSRMACLGKTPDAYWCDLEAPGVTHEGTWSSHEAVPQYYLFTVPNCWTTTWTCSTEASWPDQGQDTWHRPQLIVLKVKNTKSFHTKISFPRRLCPNDSNVWLYWLLLNADSMLWVPFSLSNLSQPSSGRACSLTCEATLWKNE